MTHNTGLTRRRAQTGMTLIELLVAMSVSSIVLAALGGALMILLRTPPETVANLTSSGSAFQTGSVFADDVESAGPESGQLAVRRNTRGCGNDPQSLLRVSTRAGGNIQVRSYSLASSDTKLERRVCSGATEADALNQVDPSVGTVVQDLDPAKPPVVTCRASAVATPAPATEVGDEQCRLVSMTVTTSTNLIFTVEGRRNTVQTPLVSPPAKQHKCTLPASVDTYVDNFPGHAFRTDGGNDHINIQHKTGGVRLNGYLRVDLLVGCIGDNEPANLPGNETLTKATLSLRLLEEDTAGRLQNDRFRLVTLPKWHEWDEDTLNYDALEVCGLTPTASLPNPLSIPCEYAQGSRPAADPSLFTPFSVGVGPQRTINIPVLPTVQNWYDGPDANQGWSLDRGWDNRVDKNEDGGWKFGTREHNGEINQPRLTIEWE